MNKDNNNKNNTSRKSLYICLTPYHIFITVLKVLAGKTKLPVSICVYGAMEGHKEYVEKLEDSNLFENVYVWGPFKTHNKKFEFYGNYMYYKFHKDLIESYFGYVHDYAEVSIYNDYSYPGAILQALDVPYHLIEDGLDCFLLYDQSVIDERANAHSSGGLRVKAKRVLYKLNVPFGMGQFKNCIDIEVNRKNGLDFIEGKPVIEAPRSELFTSVEMSEVLSKLFLIFPIPNVNAMQNGVLILTQPFLKKIGAIGPEENQCDYYSRIVKYFGPERCFIKPHPSDSSDYTTVINETHIIGKNIPIEILSFCPGLHMAAVVTYNSTSIGSISYCDKKYVCDSSAKIPNTIYLDVRRMNK